MKKTVALSIIMLLVGFSFGFFIDRLPGKDVETASLTTSVPAQQTDLSDGILPSGVEVSAFPTYNLEESTSLLDEACDAVEYMKAGDYASLSNMIHPVKGVRFVPYSTVNLSANLCFTASDIAALESNKAKYVWGITDGEGAPINLTMLEYFNSYVFNADYTKAPMIGVNNILKYGNSLENVEEVFPEAEFVDFHYPELDQKNEGYDWCTLRLVFETYNSQRKIIAIIHCQWTI